MFKSGLWAKTFSLFLIAAKSFGFTGTEEVIETVVQECLEEERNSCLGKPMENLLRQTEKLNHGPMDHQSRLTLSQIFETYLVVTDGHFESIDDLNRRYRLLGEKIQTVELFSVSPPRLDYHPLEALSVNKVFRQLGPLFIDWEGLERAGEIIEDYQADTIPWSGPWLPNTKTTLFDSDLSVLAKIDRVLNGLGHLSHSRREERMLWDILGKDSWEGHCHAWALASIVTEEPLEMIDIEGEQVSPGEQKALLVKAFDRTPTKTFGHRYSGDYFSDGAYQDLRPEAFHQMIMSYLRDKKSAFIIDKFPGEEVWQHPIFRATIKMTEDIFEPDAVSVETNVWLAQPRENLDSRPTGIADQFVKTYYYRLFIDPIPSEGGNHRVLGGDWVSQSLEDHPDFVVVPSESKPVSSNADLNKHIKVIRNLFQF